MRLTTTLILTMMAGGALAQEQYGMNYSEYADTSMRDAQQIQVTPWADSQFQSPQTEQGVRYEYGLGIERNDHLNIDASGSNDLQPTFIRIWGDPHIDAYKKR